MTTASAPRGITAAGEDAHRLPAPTTIDAASWPARSSPMTPSVRPASRPSAARTAKPSIADRSVGGTSRSATTRSAQRQAQRLVTAGRSSAEAVATASRSQRQGFVDFEHREDLYRRAVNTLGMPCRSAGTTMLPEPAAKRRSRGPPLRSSSRAPARAGRPAGSISPPLLATASYPSFPVGPGTRRSGLVVAHLGLQVRATRLR